MSSNNTNFPPPPPPPPPPVPIVQKAPTTSPKDYPLKKTPKYVTICNSACLIHQCLNIIELQYLMPYFSDSPESVKFLSHRNSIYSILQEGPMCGIVALSMASQLLKNVDVDIILQRAKDLKFTAQGEMFSAYNMATLAVEALMCKAEVITNLAGHKNLFVEHVLRGLPILIPYDSDKNHGPCCKKGQSAHWAVVSGLFLTFDPTSCNINQQDSSFLSEKDFIRSSDQPLENVEQIVNQLTNIQRIFLYCRQGKSKHVAAWDLDDLIQSNSNLFQYSDKYAGEMILPKGDSLSELCDKVVLLMPKDEI